MKRIRQLLIAAVLAGLLSVPVPAANTTGGSTTLTTIVGTTYIVSIPSSKTITYGATSTALADLELTTANLPVGGKITVTPADTNTYKLTNGGTGEIEYTLKSGGSAFSSADLDAVGEKISLSIAITEAEWKAAESGSYTGTLGFTVAYVAPSP